jgi:hypothetical protein
MAQDLLFRKQIYSNALLKKGGLMSLFLKHTMDLAHLYLVGSSLFRPIVKRRESSLVPEQVSSWQDGNDGTAIGYEASWAGIFPHPVK